MDIGGCSSKVDSDSLLQMFGMAGVGPTSRDTFADAYTGPWRPESGMLATSVDLLYDFGIPGVDFGRVTAAHCLSDIYASLARPALATACLGMPRTAIKDGKAGATLAGLHEGLTLAGVELAGGHTVYADSAFVAVSIIGADPLSAGVASWHPGRYRLLLSKPLGSGIYLAALRNGLLTDDDQREVIDVMKGSNAQAAASLASLVVASPGSLGFVTDVSGFGLLMALRGRLPVGATATISADQVPLLEKTRSILADHGVSTALGDRNFDWATRGFVTGFAHVPIVERLVLSDPQTSGGLLAAIRDEATFPPPFTSTAWYEIGEVVFGKSTETIIRVSRSTLEDK